MDIVLQIIVNGILLASVYALLSAGISFLYATTRIFHLSHGIVSIGAGYAFWWVWISLDFHPALAVIFAIVIAGAAGLLMNELVYEPLRRRGTKGLGYLIGTLGLLILGTAVVLSLFGAAPRTFNFQTPVLDFLGARITVFQIWVIVITVILLGIFHSLVSYTKFGKAMRATADNETAAEVLGIDTEKIRRQAFILVSVLAAAAGILYGLEFNLEPNKGVLLAVFGFAAAVIGGVGVLKGAILGSLIIGVLEQVVVWFLGGGFRNAIVFVLLFLFLLFRPSGLFGKKREA